MSVEWLLFGIGLAALAFALVAGGWAERIFAAVQAGSSILEHSFLQLEHDVPAAIVVDLVALAIVVPLALRSNKAWPLFAASLCVATLMTEAAQLLVHASPEAYSIIQGAWDILADALVAMAAWSVFKARRGAAAQTKTPGSGAT